MYVKKKVYMQILIYIYKPVYIAEVLSGVCLARQLRGLWQTKTYYAYATEGHARQTNKKKKVAAKQGQGGRGWGWEIPPQIPRNMVGKYI